MSIETHSIHNVGDHEDLRISNKFQVSAEKPSLSEENNFGNYFQRCASSQRQAYWGSERPVRDVCTTGIGPHEGVPCNSLWNNLTKRKSVVDYRR